MTWQNFPNQCCHYHTSTISATSSAWLIADNDKGKAWMGMWVCPCLSSFHVFQGWKVLGDQLWVCCLWVQKAPLFFLVFIKESDLFLRDRQKDKINNTTKEPISYNLAFFSYLCVRGGGGCLREERAQGGNYATTYWPFPFFGERNHVLNVAPCSLLDSLHPKYNGSIPTVS